MMDNLFVAPLEVKFVEGAPEGTFSGYASVFNVTDSHGDVIVPGAFRDSLAERKAEGRSIPMHVMHGVYGGDGLPVGVWTDVAEDDKGLKVNGKISGMATDTGRLLYERVKDGALGGLSIGYRVRPQGSVLGKKPGDPKRTLKSIDLREISLVDDPSNALAKVQEMKKLHKAVADAGGDDPESPDDPFPDVEDAIEAITAAIIRFDRMMQSYGYCGTAKDAALLMDDLRNCNLALTGVRTPDGVEGWTKRLATKREVERMLREEFKLSRSQAIEFVDRCLSFAEPRDEGSKSTDTKTAVSELSSALAGFKLT